MELGLPCPVLCAVGAGVLELVCGILLVLGLRTGWAAMVPVTVPFEQPFRSDGPLIDFLKNCAIMGGLLLVVLGERDAMRGDWNRARGR